MTLAVRLAVRLTPRGGRDAVEGWATDPAGRAFLKVRVASPAVEGQANASLVRLLAKTLALPRSAVTIQTGEAARLKMVIIKGIDEAQLRARLT